MLSIQVVPQAKPLLGSNAAGRNTVAAALPDIWEADVTVGKAKAYLVGSCLAASALDSLPGGNLQVRLLIQGVGLKI